MKSYHRQEHKGHYQILSVEHVPKGRAWFGTAEVLMEFNGEKWTHHTTGDGQYVFDVEKDRFNRLWVACGHAFGYMRVVPFDRGSKDSNASSRSGDLLFEALQNALPDTSSSVKKVRTVHPMEDRVFFQGENGVYMKHPDGLHAFRPRGEQFTRAWSSGKVFYVQDIDRGFYRIAPEDLPMKKGKHLPEHLHVKGSERFKGHPFRGLKEGVPGLVEKGELLLSHGSRGLSRFDPGSESGSFHPISEGIKGVRMNRLTSLLHADPSQKTLKQELKASNSWHAPLSVGSLTKGEMLLDTNGNIVRSIDREDGLPADFIWDTEKGPKGSGIMWSATNKGIARWDLGDPRSYALNKKKDSRAIHDLVRFRGKLIIATSEGVFYRKLKKGGKELKDSWEPVANTNENILDLIMTRRPGGKKDLWLGGLKHLLKMDRKDGKWRAREVFKKDAYHFDTLSGPNKGPSLLYVGDNGMLIADPLQERELLHVKGFPQKAVSIRAQAFQADDGSEMLRAWVGVRKPVAIVLEIPWKKLEGEKCHTMVLDEILKGEEKGVRGGYISMEGVAGEGVEFYHLNGNIVAGTDKGILKCVTDPLKRVEDSALGKGAWKKVFEADTTLGCRFTRCVDKGDGRMIFNLAESKDGEVWLRSNGITYHFIPEGPSDYRVDSIPFLGTGIGNTHAFYSEENGLTWIAGSNGLMRYDEKVEKAFDRSYPCFIENVSVGLSGDERKEHGRADSTIHRGFYRRSAPDDPLLGWKRVFQQPDSYVPKLPYRFNGLSFRFASPFFEKQDKVSYSYKLEPFNDKWSHWEKRNEKEYTNLEPGYYSFKVRAHNVYGTHSRTASYRFRILPPWYRTWTAYGGFTVAGVGFICFLLWLNGRRLRAQKLRLEKIVQERTREIQDQKETIEEAHEEITQSIDYAQKIQYALLRSEDEAAEHLPEHFVLFKPQARVSGDFYWFKEHRGFLYIAAMDCTGHGVPGAFMSMLGISQLNEIMSTDEIPSPGAVLTELRERVLRELSGSEPDETAKDGMDAAILRIPLDEEKEITFAGAQNPLYVVRKGIGEEDPSSLLEDLSGPKDLTGLGIQDRLKPFKKSPDGIEIKGDPMPVGYDEHAEGDFKTITLRVQKGDMLYIFSDGYADQFGGEKGKKFRYGPFKKLLTELHEKPLNEQKRILEKTFEDWKGDQEQIDDVLVMGVRV